MTVLNKPCRSGGKKILPSVVFAVLRVLSKYACRNSAEFVSSKYKVFYFFFPGTKYRIIETLLSC